MPSVDQWMPYGMDSTEYNRVSGPPSNATRKIAPCCQNATAVPSGENVGLTTAWPASVSGRASRSSSDRSHSCPLATNARRRPSGETAIARRPVFVSCRSGGIAVTNRLTRVTGRAARLRCVAHRQGDATAAPAAAAATRPPSAQSLSAAGSDPERAAYPRAGTAPWTCLRVASSSPSQGSGEGAPQSAGDSGGRRLQSGSCFRIAASVSAASSPSKGRVPVSISKNTQPNAQTSARLSAGRPLACSGDMYAGGAKDRPRRGHRRRRRSSATSAARRRRGRPPLALVCTPSAIFARPKSRTFTVPSLRILMLAGFRSR